MEKGIKCGEFQYYKINLLQTNLRNLKDKHWKYAKLLYFISKNETILKLKEFLC